MSTNDKTKALSRIEAIVDAGSFTEIGAQVKARSTDFALQEAAAPGDGVVTGYATIGSKLVYIYSQDASVLGGSVGEMHAKKIARMYTMAVQMGAPVIGLLDSAGLRLQESTDALEGFGQLYKAQAEASGVVPEIMAVFGKCGGGMAVLAGLADFVYLEEKNAALFVNAPNTLYSNYAEKLNTASASYVSENTGIADGVGTEEEIFENIRALVSVLPSNNQELAAQDTLDDLNRLTPSLEGIRDIRVIAGEISDDGVFVETKKDYGKAAVTGFILLDGVTVGLIGNQEERLSAEACEKISAFVCFCDAYEIPVLSLVNVKGYEATLSEEARLAIACSRLAFSFANAGIPKISVILDEALGSAYIAMNSKALGADIVYALSDSKIGLMEDEPAAKILAKDGEDLASVRSAFAKKQSAEAAEERGIVDDETTMTTLRRDVIQALEMLFNKRSEVPSKKHGTK